MSQDLSRQQSKATTAHRANDDVATPGKQTLQERQADGAESREAGEASGRAWEDIGGAVGKGVEEEHVSNRDKRDPQVSTGGITHEAFFTPKEGAPANRQRVGVGEVVNLTAQKKGTWTASAVAPNEQARATGNTFTWTAPDRAQQVLIEFQGGENESERVTFEVIEPTDVKFTWAADAGASDLKNRPYRGGMWTKVELMPFTVAWNGIEWRERGGGSDSAPNNPQGLFATVQAPLHEPNVKWVNAGFIRDLAGYYRSTEPPQGGSFDWVIPNEFRMKGGAPKEFATSVQHIEVMGEPRVGVVKVTKRGQTSGIAESNEGWPQGKTPKGYKPLHGKDEEESGLAHGLGWEDLGGAVGYGHDAGGAVGYGEGGGAVGQGYSGPSYARKGPEGSALEDRRAALKSPAAFTAEYDNSCLDGAKKLAGGIQTLVTIAIDLEKKADKGTFRMKDKDLMELAKQVKSLAQAMKGMKEGFETLQKKGFDFSKTDFSKEPELPKALDMLRASIDSITQAFETQEALANFQSNPSRDTANAWATHVGKQFSAAKKIVGAIPFPPGCSFMKDYFEGLLGAPAAYIGAFQEIAKRRYDELDKELGHKDSSSKLYDMGDAKDVWVGGGPIQKVVADSYMAPTPIGDQYGLYNWLKKHTTIKGVDLQSRPTFKLGIALIIEGIQNDEAIDERNKQSWIAWLGAQKDPAELAS